MDTSLYRKPIPALGIAVAASAAVHYANINAAQALGTSVAVVGILVALIIAAAAILISRA
jgi:hypothetical protein